MKRYLLLPLLFFLSLSLPGDEFCKVTDIRFLPPTYYPGDRLTVLIRVEVGPDCSVTPPQIVPADPYISIRDVEVSRNGDYAQVSISLTTFLPGERTVPRMELGDIEIADILLSPASLVEDLDADFQPLRDQLLLPGTRVLLVFTVTGIAAAVLAAVFLFTRLKAKLQGLRRWWHAWVEKRRLAGLLGKLEKEFSLMGADMFYRLLSGRLRSYIGILFSIPSEALTSKELDSFFTGGAAAGAYTDLAGIFRRSDEVRFGGASVRKETVLRDVSSVRGFARLPIRFARGGR